MSDTTSKRIPWTALAPFAPIAIIVTVGLGALIFTTLGNSARFDDHRLRESADHIRAQMDGSPADQIIRTVTPPRLDLIVYRGWTIHEGNQWAMCLNTGQIDDDSESRHLIFTATGPYRIHDGACPATRTLAVPN